jgi:hypothetical protein
MRRLPVVEWEIRQDRVRRWKTIQVVAKRWRRVEW